MVNGQMTIIGSSVDGNDYRYQMDVTSEGALPISGALIVSTNEIGYIQTLAYNVSNMAEYIGKAVPDSNKSGALWQIQKLIYNGNNMVTDIQFASGTSNFINIWSGATINYTTYPYS